MPVPGITVAGAASVGRRITNMGEVCFHVLWYGSRMDTMERGTSRMGLLNGGVIPWKPFPEGFHGIMPRKRRVRAWQGSRRSRELAARREAIKAHDCARAHCGPVCTAFDW